MNFEILSLALISIIIGVTPLLVHRVKVTVLFIAAAAYFTAIASKGVIQLAFLKFFITPQIPTFLAYGALTAITEPGFAYLFVRLVRQDPEGYGISLAFWENAVVVGLGDLALALYEPPLNQPFIDLVLVKIMDRLGSLFVHYSWGVCAYLSYKSRDIRYIISVAPLGFIDSLGSYVALTHANYFIASIPALVFGIVGFTVTRYYMRKKDYL